MQPVPCPASLHEEKTAVVAACLHGVAPQHIVDRACNQRRVLGIAITLVKTFALLKNVARSVLGNHIIIQPYWKHVSREFLLDAHPTLARWVRAFHLAASSCTDPTRCRSAPPTAPSLSTRLLPHSRQLVVSSYYGRSTVPVSAAESYIAATSDRWAARGHFTSASGRNTASVCFSACRHNSLSKEN